MLNFDIPGNTADYAPADMGGQLVDGLGTVMPWIGAGVGTALVLYMAFLGIRAGFTFFQLLAENRKEKAYLNSGLWDYEDGDSRYVSFEDFKRG